MFTSLEGRFTAYNFLWSQVEQERDPVIRAALERNFDAFRKFVRTEDRRQRILEERMRDAEDFLAAVAAEIEETECLPVS
jgi:hypothetical protein